MAYPSNAAAAVKGIKAKLSAKYKITNLGAARRSLGSKSKAVSVERLVSARRYSSTQFWSGSAWKMHMELQHPWAYMLNSIWLHHTEKGK